MSQSNIAIIIYVIGVLIGAIFMDIWGAETNIKKVSNISTKHSFGLAQAAIEPHMPL